MCVNIYCSADSAKGTREFFSSFLFFFVFVNSSDFRTTSHVKIVNIQRKEGKFLKRCFYSCCLTTSPRQRLLKCQALSEALSLKRMPKENDREEDGKTRQRSGGHDEDRNSSDESTAATPRRMHRNMVVSGSPAMRPGISYSVEDIRGR